MGSRQGCVDLSTFSREGGSEESPADSRSVGSNFDPGHFETSPPKASLWGLRSPGLPGRILLLGLLLLFPGHCRGQTSRVYSHPQTRAWVRGVLDRIVTKTGWTRDKFTLTLLNDSQVNASAGAKGDVTVTLGLLRMVDSDDELAAAIAHEVTHVVKHHVKETAEKQVLTGSIVSLISAVTQNENVRSVGRLAGNLGVLQFTRKEETEADDLGFDFLVKAGYAPQGFVTMLEKLAQASRSPDFLSILSTHPSSSERLRRIQQRLAALSPGIRNRRKTLSFRGLKSLPAGLSWRNDSTPNQETGSEEPTAETLSRPSHRESIEPDKPIGWLGGSSHPDPGKPPSLQRGDLAREPSY